MPIYNIAGITIDFTYQYQDFFKDNIEKYQVTDQTKATYTMKTEIHHFIKCPSGLPTMSHKNRFVHVRGDKIIITATNDQGEILQSIEHEKKYRNVVIKLSSRLNQRLPEIEYMLTGQIFIELAILEQKLAIHGSAFTVNNEAIIISASSGVGKSTHAQYWKKVFSTFVMINDDKPLIHVIDNQFYVSGTPWSGKSKANSNITMPLKAIVFYHQGDKNRFKTLASDEQLRQLMNHALRPRGEPLMTQALEMMDALIRGCPMLDYHAVNDSSSVEPLYQKIYGGKQ